MKVYKLDEKKLKKQKLMNILGGIVALILCAIDAYLFVLGYTRTVASTSFFGALGVSLLMAVSSLEKFYYELDGNVLTSYIRGKKFSQHDLTKVEVEIKEKKKKSKITIKEHGRVKAVHKGNYVGVEAFDELINDVKVVLKQQ